MDDRPITPHAVPIFDSDGNLTYVGDDGRRYVVGPLPETDEANVDRVMERLREGQALFSQIEQLSGQWLDHVSGADLERHSALALPQPLHHPIDVRLIGFRQGTHDITASVIPHIGEVAVRIKDRNRMGCDRSVVHSSLQHRLTPG